jgi:hypothetical protein
MHQHYAASDADDAAYHGKITHADAAKAHQHAADTMRAHPTHSTKPLFHHFANYHTDMVKYHNAKHAGDEQGALAHWKTASHHYNARTMNEEFTPAKNPYPKTSAKHWSFRADQASERAKHYSTIANKTDTKKDHRKAWKAHDAARDMHNDAETAHHSPEEFNHSMHDTSWKAGHIHSNKAVEHDNAGEDHYVASI